jgi:hypothetical protein
MAVRADLFILPHFVSFVGWQMAVNHQLKTRIRAELFRCAISGSFETYTKFFNRIRPGVKMGNFPYQVHFDEIAREELKRGYPDITFMVHGVNGYPHRIGFRDASKGPDAAQLKYLRTGTDDIIRVYCPPNTTNPY